jgi:hypothetical protein
LSLTAVLLWPTSLSLLESLSVYIEMSGFGNLNRFLAFLKVLLFNVKDRIFIQFEFDSLLLQVYIVLVVVLFI